MVLNIGKTEFLVIQLAKGVLVNGKSNKSCVSAYFLPCSVKYSRVDRVFVFSPDCQRWLIESCEIDQCICALYPALQICMLHRARRMTSLVLRGHGRPVTVVRAFTRAKSRPAKAHVMKRNFIPNISGDWDGVGGCPNRASRSEFFFKVVVCLKYTGHMWNKAAVPPRSSHGVLRLQ